MQTTEEFLALSSIYGNDIQFDGGAISLAIDNYTLEIVLSNDYPNKMPSFSLKHPSIKISSILLIELSTAFAQDFRAGQVCIFDWIQTCGSVISKQPPLALKVMEIDLAPPLVYISPPLLFKKSLFIGYASPVSSTTFPQRLSYLHAQTPKRATHKMHALILSNTSRLSNGTFMDSISNGSFQQQELSGDDGESGSSARMLDLLRLTKTTNVLLLVSRTHGGTMLGNARFKCILDVARGALKAGSFIPV